MMNEQIWLLRPYLTSNRPESAAYIAFDSICDVGEVRDGREITAQHFITLERSLCDLFIKTIFDGRNQAVFAADEINFSEALAENCELESLHGLDRVSIRRMPKLASGLSYGQFRDLMRLMIRECCWCSVRSQNGAFLHVGYDLKFFLGFGANTDLVANEVSRNLGMEVVENPDCPIWIQGKWSGANRGRSV